MQNSQTSFLPKNFFKKPASFRVKVVKRHSLMQLQNANRAQMSFVKLLQQESMAQCPRTDLNKRSLPRPKTTTA